MEDWKYIKTVNDLPTEDDEYLVVVRESDEALTYGCVDFVTVSTFECDQKLWSLGDNWYINPLLTLGCKDRSVRHISHWTKMPGIPKESDEY